MKINKLHNILIVLLVTLGIIAGFIYGLHVAAFFYAYPAGSALSDAITVLAGD